MTDEAMVEAVARALAESWGADPDLFVLGRPAWRSHKAEARAAIRAVVPLLIEQCAEVARRHAEEHAMSLGAYGAADVDSGRGRQEGHIDAGRTIAEGICALAAKKEPSCAPAGVTSPPR